ncbi:hypothetical protein OIV83_006294 [Microbotryomycetes sp. JL201]|nr:hypothetical protein OIV83_006294 [Microbotryomycetes sp. JL201]
MSSNETAPAPRAATVTVQPTPILSGYGQTEGMSDRLQEISDRLKSIEASLANVHLSPSTTSAFKPYANSPPSAVSGHAASESESSLSHMDEPSQIVVGVGSVNPLQTVSESVSLLDAFEQENGGSNGDAPPVEWSSRMNSGNENTQSIPPPFISSLFSSMTAPDVIARGILSAEECDASFKIFFRLVEPWFLLLDIERDSDAMAVRRRSPFLFHAILLTTAYYLMDTSQRGATVYHSLMSLVNEIVAPMIISTQPYHLRTDTVKALILLLLYKPVQFASLHAAEITDPEHAEQMCKLSATSSSTLWGVVLRTSHTIVLHNSPNAFAKIYSPTIKPPPEILSSLRTWLWTCVVDTHGALTTSRVGVVDMTDALKVVRMFASLQAQPGDVRIASHVELYGCAKAVMSSSWFLSPATKSVSEHELRRFNRSLDEWEEYWAIELTKVANQGDALAPTVISTWRNLVQIIVNSVVFTRWRATRKSNVMKGVPGLPQLSTGEWSFLQQLVDAFERLVFALCEESRCADSPLRRVQWQPRDENGLRPPLTLDKNVVEMYRTSYDPVSAVGFIYPLILVTKMANAGLTICELECSPKIWDKVGSPGQPKRLVRGAKLHRLLDLGADFLEAIAPTRTHPARKHSRMLRTILAAGLLGVSPSARSGASVSSDATLAAAPSQRTANPSTSFMTSMPLPPLGAPMVGAPAPNTAGHLARITDSSTPLSPNSAGEQLESILQGISPSYFGAPGMFEGMDFGGNLDSVDMSIDWVSLERGIRLESQRPDSQEQQGRNGRSENQGSFPFPSS